MTSGRWGRRSELGASASLRSARLCQVDGEYNNSGLCHVDGECNNSDATAAASYGDLPGLTWDLRGLTRTYTNYMDYHGLRGLTRTTWTITDYADLHGLTRTTWTYTGYADLQGVRELE